MRGKNEGFTLVELIISVFILGVLAAILVPQYIHFVARAHEQAALTDCSNCVTVASNQFEEELITDGSVPMAATPGEAENPVLSPTGKSPYADIIDEANVKGTIKSIVYANDQISTLVYETKDGKYTVTFSGGDYTLEKKEK